MSLSGRAVENVNWIRNAERRIVETTTTRSTTNPRSIECSGSNARTLLEVTARILVLRRDWGDRGARTTAA